MHLSVCVCVCVTCLLVMGALVLRRGAAEETTGGVMGDRPGPNKRATWLGGDMRRVCVCVCVRFMGRTRGVCNVFDRLLGSCCTTLPFLCFSQKQNTQYALIWDIETFGLFEAWNNCFKMRTHLKHKDVNVFYCTSHKFCLLLQNWPKTDNQWKNRLNLSFFAQWYICEILFQITWMYSTFFAWWI